MYLSWITDTCSLSNNCTAQDVLLDWDDCRRAKSILDVGKLNFRAQNLDQYRSTT